MPQKRKITDSDEEVERDDFEFMEHSDEEGGLHIDDIYIPPKVPPACSTTNTGPRLIIQHITCKWFKSYANEVTIGPYQKCFNAVVGPNGSGKSNIIDSMLYVFGYRATRIRCKKISSLIHNSQQYNNVDSCTVSVHFARIIDKDRDNYDVIPGSEFVVSRVGHKDNTSYYQLNGRRVQFKEVSKLLKQHGIDLDHNRFLILQGEVELISLMKPKGTSENETGMLEYLEDIIGTSRYKAPIAKLKDRLEILHDQKLEKVNRLKLVQKNLNELEGPMQEAVNYLSVENEIITYQNMKYQREIYNTEMDMEKVEQKRQMMKAVYDEVESDLLDLTKEKAETDKKLTELSKKYEHFEKQKELMTTAFNNANNKDLQLQEEMERINKNRKKMKEALAEERKKLIQYEKVPGESEKSIVEYQAKDREMTVKKQKSEEKKQQILLTLESEVSTLYEKQGSLQTKLIELKSISSEADAAFALAKSEHQIYISKHENESNILSNCTEAYNENVNSLQQLTVEEKTLKQKIPLTEKSLADAVKDLGVTSNQLGVVLDEINSKKRMVEENKFTLQNAKSRSKVLDALLRQKRERKIPGFFNRLGDLGAIDQKYDVAISTACGALDHMVVDTVDTAQQCIEYLREYNIGRASFIVLEKQEHLQQLANSTIQTPENVPRLFDLIEFSDDTFKTAFYFALRDTLVSNDLDQGSRIAYGAQRYRVVTLGGDIIEMTGTMSGGGKVVARGRMGQSVVKLDFSQDDINRIENEVRELQNRLHDLQARKRNLEAQINSLQPELEEMKIKFAKVRDELQSVKERRPVLEKRLRDQEEKVRVVVPDPDTIKKLTAIVNKKKTEYERALEKSSALEKEIDIIKKEIETKTSSKLNSVDREINDAKKSIEKCRAEVARLNVAIKTSERNLKKSQEKITTMEQDILNFEKDLIKMRDERNEIESDALKLNKCMENVEDQVKDSQNQYLAAKSEVKDFKSRETELKNKKLDFDQKLKAFDSKINGYRGEIRLIKSKITNLELRNIPTKSVDPLKTYTKEELESMDLQMIERNLNAKKAEVKSSKPNVKVIDDYLSVQVVYIQRTKDLDELMIKYGQMNQVLESVCFRRKEEFIEGYQTIRMKLKEMYQMLTLGGDADLEQVDNFDPFTEGIQFNVRPPKKAWKVINNLSGGEKTLSSLSLVFALHYYKPSPLYIMDEIDAALDFKNVSIVANYIKERTTNAQFIIISLRSNMYELCDYLIGIYKIHNCTHSITIDPRIYEQPNKDLNKGQVNHKQSETPRGAQDNSAPNSSNNEISTHSTETNNSVYDDSCNNDNEDNNDDECLGNVVVEDSFEGEDMDVDDN